MKDRDVFNFDGPDQGELVMTLEIPVLRDWDSIDDMKALAPTTFDAVVDHVIADARYRKSLYEDVELPDGRRLERWDFNNKDPLSWEWGEDTVTVTMTGKVKP